MIAMTDTVSKAVYAQRRRPRNEIANEVKRADHEHNDSAQMVLAPRYPNLPLPPFSPSSPARCLSLRR